MLVSEMNVKGCWVCKILVANLASVLHAVGEQVSVQALPILQGLATNAA